MKKIWVILFALVTVLGLSVIMGAKKSTAPPTPPPAATMTDAEADVLAGKLAEFANFTVMMCQEIYPEPKSWDECLDSAKHAVAAGFDPHSGYLSAQETREMMIENKGKFGGVGLEVSKTFAPSTATYVSVMNVLEHTPAERAGIMAGDLITKIGTKNGDFVSTLSMKKIEEAITLMRGAPGTSVTIEIERKGIATPFKVTLVREEIKMAQITGTLLHDGAKTFALLTTRQFNDGFAPNMKASYLALAQEAKKAGTPLSGLIVNLENNPGGNLHEVHNALDLFLDAESFVLERGNDGISAYQPEKEQRIATPGDITNGLPMLVIVNGRSASASEIFSGALKHYGRAVIAGTSSTFGKGTVQELKPLPHGDMVKVTKGEYVIGSLKDWIPVQCIGVSPDISFTYPGINTRKGFSECELSGKINSGGPMAKGPVHRPIKEVNPALYAAGEEMLKAFIVHHTPELKKEEERIKALDSASE